MASISIRIGVPSAHKNENDPGPAFKELTTEELRKDIDITDVLIK